MLEFSYTIDPSALDKIKQFAGWKLILEEELLRAHKKSTDALQDAARANMHWKNPSGKLEGSLQSQIMNPYASWMGTDLKYSRRREYGFTGMTDSIGRYYAHDPGQFYMTDALKQKTGDIDANFTEAVNAALTRLGGA